MWWRMSLKLRFLLHTVGNKHFKAVTEKLLFLEFQNFLLTFSQCRGHTKGLSLTNEPVTDIISCSDQYAKNQTCRQTRY